MRRADTNKFLFRPSSMAQALSFALAVVLCAGGGAGASELDHREFAATLHAPYAAEAEAEARGARTFTLAFDYPLVAQAQDIYWRLELLGPAGQVVQRWDGVQRLFRKPVSVKVRWAGRDARVALPDGVYQVRMQALARDAGTAGAGASAADPLEPALSAGAPNVSDAADAAEVIEQSWDIAVGTAPAPPLPAFSPLPTTAARDAANQAPAQLAGPAPAQLPYTVYLANLHSQTNHSDGGGELASCTGSQAPLAAPYGPADAYAYARARGLDILMASEHNHMYDGSSGTNASANPASARALYQAGLTAAADFNAAHPDFLAVYGLEWGVINKGGHLNIFNTPELLQWEVNGSGQLIGDTLTDKADYAALYTLMRQRGWLGQFNHPSGSGQFQANGVALGYTADGDQAMALCEVLNTSAFSVNTTETETGRSSYEGACNKALEAGFHVAFSSNQDNHCANWGASYTNRTGILIPAGTPLTQASFIDALRARRVFATMDKTSQLVLTGNGRLMGERFTNSGALHLVANYASSGGKTASTVSIVEGVPGRNGAVSQLSASADTTITPSVGEHFYYARLTQSDGKILWSAPIWVTQMDGNAGDITPPSVSASVAPGDAGGASITVRAAASDNVGVVLVEFRIDGLLKASSSAAPYSAAIKRSSLGAGRHTLTARAVDAAGNSKVSSPVSFTVGS